MSSPINGGRKWLLSTCRGRVQHLREHLPNWLERMPTWDPVVVCCDDHAAFEYCAGELMLAGRGIALLTEQGQYFNRLEAIRAGIGVIQSGLCPTGQAFTARIFPPDPAADNDLVAMWDADTVAIRGTEHALSTLTATDVAIAASTQRQEMGILVASVRLLRLGLEEIPPNWFRNYGHEDCGLRLGVWAHHRREFLKIRPCWSRKQHGDRMRREHYGDLLDRSGARNCEVLGELVARLVPPGDVPLWREHCYFPGTYQKGRIAE